MRCLSTQPVGPSSRPQRTVEARDWPAHHARLSAPTRRRQPRAAARTSAAVAAHPVRRCSSWWPVLRRRRGAGRLRALGARLRHRADAEAALVRAARAAPEDARRALLLLVGVREARQLAGRAGRRESKRVLSAGRLRLPVARAGDIERDWNSTTMWQHV